MNESGRWHGVCSREIDKGYGWDAWGTIASAWLIDVGIASSNDFSVLKSSDPCDVIVYVRRQMPFLECLSFVFLLPFLHVRDHQHVKHERR